MSSTTLPPSDLSTGEEGDGSRGKSVQRGIASASALMMLAVLLSRLLGLVRDRVIAMKFGQGFETDAYNAAFTVPDLLSYVIAGGAISSAVIPVFTQFLQEDREREAWRIFSVVAIVTTYVVTAFILVGEIFAEPLVVWLNPGPKFAPHVAMTVTLTRILLPAQLCFFLGGLMMGVQQTRDKFFGQQIGPIIYNLGIILGGTVLIQFAPADNRIMMLCWGALIGAFVGNIIVQWTLVRKIGGQFYCEPLRRLLRDPGVKEGAKQIWYMMLPILLGVALPQIAAITNKYFASYLTPGAQSALMNANRMMQVPLGVFAQALAIAIFPTMAAQFARRDMSGLRSTTNCGLRFIFFMTIPASVLMIVLSMPIVQLLLQGGKYDGNDAIMASSALRYYALGIFAWSGQSILARAFYSLKNSKVPVIVGTVATLIFIPMNRPLMELYGYRGLALATTIASALNMFALLFLLRVRLKGIQGGKLLRSVTKTVLASGAMGAVCYALRKLFDPNPTTTPHPVLHAFLTLILCGGVGLIVFFGLGMLMRMEEMNSVRGLMKRFRNRNRKAGG